METLNQFTPVDMVIFLSFLFVFIVCLIILAAMQPQTNSWEDGDESGI